MTPAERARHAALVRWKKENPLGARLQALREKRRGKGKTTKQKPTPEQRQAEKEAQRLANRKDALAQLKDKPNAAALAALDALAGGGDADPDMLNALADETGLVDRHADGSLTLSPTGGALLRALDQGNAASAAAALARGKDAGARSAARAARQAEREKAKAEKPGGGGGGKGKSEKDKPSKADKDKGKTQERERTAKETARKAGLKDDEVAFLRGAAEGNLPNGSFDARRLMDLGLVEDTGDTTEATDAGRRALTALERGDVRGYRAAVQDARERQTRTRERAARTAARAADRARREQDRAKRKAEGDARHTKREHEHEHVERKRDRSAPAAPFTKAETTMSDYAPLLDDLEALADELAAIGDAYAGDAAIKAGRRHSASDAAMVQAIYDGACNLKELALELGAEDTDGYADTETETETGGEAEVLAGKSIDLQDKIDRIRTAWYEAHPVPVDPRPLPPEIGNALWLVTVLDDGVVIERTGKLYRATYTVENGVIAFAPESAWEPVQRGFTAVKGIEFLSDDLAVYAGESVKAIDAGAGWTGGYLVTFGGAGDLTQWRDVFDDETDFGSATKSDVYTHHRMLPGLGRKRLKNQAEISQDEVGVFVKHLLDLRDPYEKALYGLVQQGKLGWSSGTAPHLVERQRQQNGSHVIKHWPLGLDASYTPTPAGGLDTTATSMKSLFADAGIDLLQAIYDDPEAPDAATHAAAIELIAIEAEYAALSEIATHTR